MMNIYQESVELSSGKNLQQIQSQYQLPKQDDNVAVFLISGSYEYDLEMIKKMPPPRMIKKIIIPYFLNAKIGPVNLKYTLTTETYKQRVQYLMKQKMIPALQPVNPPINKLSTENVYVSLSDVITKMNQTMRSLSPDYIQRNAPQMLSTMLQQFSGSKKKIVIVNTDKFKIYSGDPEYTMKSDMINGLIGAYLSGGKHPLTQDITMISRSATSDYKMDLRMTDANDVDKLKTMCEMIGTPVKKPATGSTDADVEETMDEMIDDINAKTAEDNNGDVESDTNGGSGKSSNLAQSIQALKEKFGVNTDNKTDTSMYRAKTFEINASLLHRITPNETAVSNYEHIANDLEVGGDKPVENQMIQRASQSLATMRRTSDMSSIMGTITSPREMKLRSDIGQIRLKELNVNSVGSVTDIPLPEANIPAKITTLNPGSMKGSAFPKIAKAYEDNLMDQDIVSTFMTLQKLPEGFVVTNIEVSDISTPISALHNWRVTLKNRRSGTQSHIDIVVPVMQNGRFLYNGSKYTIGKQDFPIPILKINKKTVILTTNYNKIMVSRYDTKSLVDISLMLKALASKNDHTGKNPYVVYGSSSVTNNRFISTIEYDEYARKIYKFENKEANCTIIFNRDKCATEYGFVNVNENEFCCGMINQVPIVMNTDTGLDRHGKSLTDIMVSALPSDIVTAYNKGKPSKISMHADIKIGVLIPLGVAIAGWEGLPSLLKRSGAQYKYVGPREETPGFLKIPFKDKVLAIQNTVYNQLVFNGFYRINTRQYNTTDFDTTIMEDNSVWVDIFNQLFFKSYSQRTTFITYYHFFVDAITYDVCNHYHVPNNIADMLLYAANMLADNNFASEQNASLYRVRSSEIIPALIHYNLAVAISKYNNSVGSKTRDNKLVFNRMTIMNDLMAIQTISTSSALNPMIELHEDEIVSKKGYGGVNEDKAYTEAKRSFDETMIGKIAMSTPNSANVGMVRQMCVDPKIESVRGYTSTKGADAEYNDLQLSSFSELLTPGTVTHDDAIRTAIATSQTGHILPVDDAQPVLVSNGMDEIAASYLSDEFVVTADEDGQVIDIADGYMIVQYASKKKRAIPVSSRYSFNPGSGFYVDNKLISNFQKGDKFVKNDILAYHEKFFSKDSAGMVRMNLGPLAKVAFCGTYATYEDAGIMTHKMSKRLGTHVTMCQASKLEAMDDVESIVKVGDEVEIGDPLIVFGLGDTGDKSVDQFLKAFRDANSSLDSAKRIVRSKHAGVVKEIRMYTCKSLDKLSPSLFEIIDQHFKENIQKRKMLDKYDKSDSVMKMGTFYNLPTRPLGGTTIKGIHCDVLIEIYIEHGDDVSIGDKCVVYAASKQVISEIIPEGLEPYAESDPDEEVSMFVSAGSILKRMIPSVVLTGAANKVLVNLKRQIAKIYNG